MQPCTHSCTHLNPEAPGQSRGKRKSQDKEYRQPPCRKHTPMAGVDLDLGMGRGMWNQVQQSPSVLLSLLEKHLVPNGFHRWRFKGQVHHFLPSFSFYHPSFLLFLHSFPLLLYTSPIAHKTQFLMSFLVAGFSIQKHTQPHTHIAT